MHCRHGILLLLTGLWVLAYRCDPARRRRARSPIPLRASRLTERYCWKRLQTQHAVSKVVAGAGFANIRRRRPLLLAA